MKYKRIISIIFLNKIEEIIRAMSRQILCYCILLISLKLTESVTTCGPNRNSPMFSVPNNDQQLALNSKMKTGIQFVTQGSFSLTPSTQDKRYSYYNVSTGVNTSLSWPYEVALSLVYIENFFDPGVIDFSIRSVKYPTFFTALLMISQTSIWKLAHVHYIITAREDLRVGMFTSSPQQILKSSIIPTKIIVEHTLLRPWILPERLIRVNLFISGLKTKDIYININIIGQSSSFSNDVITCYLEISEQNKPIQFLTFSYVIFTGYNSAISVLPISDPVSQIYSVLGTGKVAQESIFLGMTQVNAQSLKQNFELNKPPIEQSATNPIRLLVQQILPLQSSPRIASFQKSFHINGLKFINEAVFASLNDLIDNGLLIMNNKQECLTVGDCAALGGNTIFQATKGRSCILCLNKQQFNPATNKCECIKGYAQNPTGKCSQEASFCSSNEIYLQGSCFQLIEKLSPKSCGANQTLNITANTCICKQGYKNAVGANSTQQCVSICKIGQIYNQLTKSCKCQFYQNASTQCILCAPLTEIVNPITKNCICRQNFMKIQDKCLQCSINSTFNQLTRVCICKSGYSGDGVNCIIAKTSLANITIIPRLSTSP